MPYDIDTAGRPRLSAVTDMDLTDRILLAVCAAVWLVVLGAGVAAIVALVDLGRGRAAASDTGGTPWLLYVVIGVSAVVIAVAVPLLIRARRSALAESAPAPTRDIAAGPAPGPPPVPAHGAEAPTEKLRVFGSVADASDNRRPAPEHAAGEPARGLPMAVDQLWLRCAVVMAIATGVATLTIAVATYLMAVSNDGIAWFGYGLAGVITLALPVVPWFYLRELQRELETADQE